MKLSLGVVLFLSAGALAQTPALRLVQTIPLVGVEGRIDHMDVDVAGQRLFIAALGNDSVEIVDLRAGKRVHSVGGFRAPQGVAWIPDRNQLFVSSGGDNSCHILDGNSFTTAAVGDNIEDADNVRYDAAAHRLYVGCGSGSLRIFDTTNWNVAGEISLPAHPEAFALEHHGKRIFANVPGVRHVEIVDRSARRVVDSWSLKSTLANFPIALDEDGRHLLVGSRTPPMLTVFNTDSRHEIANVPIDGDADDVFYDALRKRIYVSCGAGFIDVIEASGYKRREQIPTASGARTSLFVPELHRLYLAVPHRGGQQAEIRVYETTAD